MKQILWIGLAVLFIIVAVNRYFSLTAKMQSVNDRIDTAAQYNAQEIERVESGQQKQQVKIDAQAGTSVHLSETLDVVNDRLNEKLSLQEQTIDNLNRQIVTMKQLSNIVKIETAEELEKIYAMLIELRAEIEGLPVPESEPTSAPATYEYVEENVSTPATDQHTPQGYRYVHSPDELTSVEETTSRVCPTSALNATKQQRILRRAIQGTWGSGSYEMIVSYSIEPEGIVKKPIEIEPTTAPPRLQAAAKRYFQTLRWNPSETGFDSCRLKLKLIKPKV
jgi:uncharacterized coiled-coil protein SlyX